MSRNNSEIRFLLRKESVLALQPIVLLRLRDRKSINLQRLQSPRTRRFLSEHRNEKQYSRLLFSSNCTAFHFNKNWCLYVSEEKLQRESVGNDLQKVCKSEFLRNLDDGDDASVDNYENKLSNNVYYNTALLILYI